MLRGLANGWSESGARGNDGDGAAGGHCGLMLAIFFHHKIEVISICRVSSQCYVKMIFRVRHKRQDFTNIRWVQGAKPYQANAVN